MWFISKYVDNKNKEAWAAQSVLNQKILEGQNMINQRIDHYFDGIKELHQIIRKLELKLTKGKK